MRVIHEMVSEFVMRLACDESSEVRRSLLINCSALAEFFGQVLTAERLLPVVLAFLNFKDWHVREALLDAVVSLSVYLGKKSFYSFVYPCLLQGLNGTFVPTRACCNASHFWLPITS